MNKVLLEDIILDAIAEVVADEIVKSEHQMAANIQEWRHSVLERDGHRCTGCGTSEGTIFAHHIKPKDRFPHLYLSINNGRTMCKPCHEKLHYRLDKRRATYTGAPRVYGLPKKMNSLFIYKHLPGMHDQDTHGRRGDITRLIPEAANQETSLYHGTASQYINEILKEGIEPQTQHNFARSHYMGERAQSVYVSRSFPTAMDFAQKATDKIYGRIDENGLPDINAYPVVFKVKVKRGDLNLDERVTSGVAFYKKGKIPPEDIIAYTTDGYTWKGAHETKAEDLVAYVPLVLVVTEKENKKNIYKHQAPAPHEQSSHGSWARSVDGEFVDFDVLPPPLRQKIHDEVSQWEGDRGLIAKYATESREANKTILIQKNGETMGVAAVRFRSPIISATTRKMCYLADLATKTRGYGEAMMKKVAEIAAKKGSGVLLYALDEAIPFYRHIGMHQINRDEHIFVWSKEEAAAMAKASKLTPYEPENGCFCSSEFAERNTEKFTKHQAGPEHRQESHGNWAQGIAKTGRQFSDEEAYGWHEKGEVRDWALSLSKEEHGALSDYYGFGYSDINNALRGNPPKRLFEREATPEEKRRIIENDYKPIDLGDGRTLRLSGLIARVEWEDVDVYNLERVTQTANQINNIISSKGISLKENIEVSRAGYLPGVTVENLQDSIGKVREEKGFTSTFLGPAGGRATSDGYLNYGVAESKYKRYGGKIDVPEVGTAVKFQIVLPKGTKVASIEAARRTSYKHRDGTYDLDDPTYRSESEVLLGSGANFRILSVEKKPDMDVSGIKVPYVSVRMTYIGGGSSGKN